ncbi:hypothetical protein AMIS_80460 [Actinoplanes missouriensis 431]|uniref:Lipoprotein n=1 Tax=Actinoplanes missouriensis (strain ATCC 14538 / DSM 43046 / CBS 188.64 / JCM 3121 / NBRC 102363 / NCIMB 12654 / NRRL B-3342 / UNCC 431) TaxID=512565 RepID=I0HJS9_ACTM4|nr:hypothetical protein [Actinoplanes missouriensis]BAL93266.1 hypothetical protein AMIS_80460 [Actinoplanes missouriensis 431]
MSPRTRRLLPATGLLLLAGCVAQPQAAPALTGVPAPPASVPAVAPSLPGVTFVPLTPTATTPAPAPTFTTYPTVVPTVVPTTTTTTATGTTTTPTTSPTPSPTPSQAKKCTGAPTGRQILTLLKDNPAVPDAELEVAGGPFCGGAWSYTTVQLKGGGAEALSVVTTGKGTTLALVTAGTDVCNPRVKAEAPVGIRVLACGY